MKYKMYLKVWLVCLVWLTLCNCQDKSDEKCRVLVLEGGGDRGIYHAGAFDQLVELLPAAEVAYDMITGISVGSMNALALSFFEKGQEEYGRAFLNQIWKTMTREQVYYFWPWYVLPLTQRTGLLDTSPLKEYITSMATQHPIRRNYSIGTSDINEGVYRRFTNNDLTTIDDKVNALMASSAIPGLFPFVQWRNTTFVDGGMMKNFDVVAGINHCLDQGFTQQQIIIDAILCYGHTFKIQQGVITNTIQNIGATVQLEANRFFLDDLKNAQSIYPDVFYRYLVVPYVWLDGDLFINFDQESMQEMYKSGQKDVQDLLNKYPIQQGNYKEVVQHLEAQKKAHAIKRARA